MGPPPGALAEMEEFDTYKDTSVDAPKGCNKRAAGPSRGAPPAKKPAVAAKKAKKAKAAPKAKPVKRVKPAIIVASIDFGTTFTGFTYAYSGNAAKLETITDWVEGNGDDPKTPSAIKFGRGQAKWGIEAQNIPEALRWFKLLLVNKNSLPADVRDSTQLQEARNQLQRLEKSPVEVVASFLKLIWSHCLEVMRTAEGEETVDTSRLHVVVTLPAIWPNYARDRMRQAVERAGILKQRPGVGKTTLEFVTEPEAAALAALSGVDGRHNIEIHDSFVIVDCGGGTADLISYKVTKTSPMEVKEVVKGEGALCGAIFVDERFENLLKQKLKLMREDALDRIDKNEFRDMMIVNWENGIRKVFTGEAREWTIRYPYSLIDHDQVRDAGGFPTFTITSEEVKEVFRPIMEKIQALVVQQINAVVAKEDKLPKYVILVGGFGRCKYMHQYLKQRCLTVEVLQRQGFEPWSAISRGAVIHGLTQQKVPSPFISQTQIRSRIARASYGVVCQEKWDEENHDEDDHVVDNTTGQEMAIRQMKWTLRQGQDIDKGHITRYELYKYLREMPETLTTDIYMSTAENPTTRRDASVKVYCKVTWDIKIDWDSLLIYTNNQGEKFRQLDYAVEMKCDGGASVFSIIHDGRKQAAKDVTVEVHENSDI